MQLFFLFSLPMGVFASSASASAPTDADIAEPGCKIESSVAKIAQRKEAQLLTSGSNSKSVDVLRSEFENIGAQLREKSGGAREKANLNNDIHALSYLNGVDQLNVKLSKLMKLQMKHPGSRFSGPDAKRDKMLSAQLMKEVRKLAKELPAEGAQMQKDNRNDKLIWEIENLGVELCSAYKALADKIKCC